LGLETNIPPAENGLKRIQTSSKKDFVKNTGRVEKKPGFPIVDANSAKHRCILATFCRIYNR
jgi:hypothetical protein